jgi:hypothetical protein
MSSATETAAAAATVAVENIEASAQAAIDDANARAEAAQAVAAAVTDAAIQKEISDRVDDLAEDVVECREENQSLRLTISNLEAQIAEILTKLAAPPTVIVAPAAPLPQSIPPASPGETSETVATVVTTVEPSNANAGDRPAAATPTAQRKPRLI